MTNESTNIKINLINAPVNKKKAKPRRNDDDLHEQA